MGRFGKSLSAGVLVALHAVSVAALFAAPNDGPEAQKEGWHFQTGTADVNNSAAPTEREMLAALLEESKKQTALQERILAVLQNEFDPQPETIVGKDGKRCIANATADCFKTPITADAKRIPVLRAYLENPTIETARAYKKWEAVLINRAADAGISGTLAVQEGGTEVMPTFYKTADHTSLYGGENVKADAYRYERIAKEGRYLIFIGSNTDLDLMGVGPVASLAKSLGPQKVSLVFENEAAKFLYEEASESVPLLKKVWPSIAAKEVRPELFDEYGIYTTPQYVFLYEGKKEKWFQTVATGPVVSDTVADRTMGLLALKGVIPRAETAQYKIMNWKSDEAEMAKGHFEERYNLRLNLDKYKEMRDEKR